ncbi:MAG: integrin alpha, partial [Myxococcota bacterium]
DVDGDGIADMAVGAPQEAAGSGGGPVVREGAVFLFLGGDLEATEPYRLLDNPTGQRDANFGLAVAGGDVDGDGIADVIVGAPQQRSGADADAVVGEGTVFVYLGSRAGPQRRPDVTVDNPADQLFGFFGQALGRPADVNGDGFLDLVVGAPSQESGEGDDRATSEGTVFILFGGASGPRSDGGADGEIDNPTDQARGFFGSGLAVRVEDAREDSTMWASRGPARDLEEGRA